MKIVKTRWWEKLWKAQWEQKANAWLPGSCGHESQRARAMTRLGIRLIGLPLATYFLQ